MTPTNLDDLLEVRWQSSMLWYYGELLVTALSRVRGVAFIIGGLVPFSHTEVEGHRNL